MNEQQAATKFLHWLNTQVIEAGRGDNIDVLPVEPGGKFWLGRLASEEAVLQDLGGRDERLNPCAIGVRLKPASSAPWRFRVLVSACAWLRELNAVWRKCPKIREIVEISLDEQEEEYEFGRSQLEQALTAACGQKGLSCAIRVENIRSKSTELEMTIYLVNTSPAPDRSGPFKDTSLYECELEVEGLSTIPFVMEALPDSFRYDRIVAAYGVNCGIVTTADGAIQTTDTVDATKARPAYWNVPDASPDLSFDRLATDPVPALAELVEAHTAWGNRIWTVEALNERSLRCNWTQAMRGQAGFAAGEFWTENGRLVSGLNLLKNNSNLLRSFQLMNRAISHSANGKYDRWRPFQIGFLLANLDCITSSNNDSAVADVVWFATGGGKTETYLGLLVTAAFYDRLRGKTSGITAWSRFPLRMLSLQQTQRFADALAGAELVRLEEQIGGDCFSVGFLVGQGATPNSIPEEPKPGDPDPDDDTMPGRYQVLLKCPFCHSPTVKMKFDRRSWQLAHECSNESCPRPDRQIPFYIVDEEIYRFLPTVVVGTLDKAASIGMQGGMRCLVGPPSGRCSEPAHGFVYAQRSKRPHGCLVPGCRGKRLPLEQPADLYPPSFRLQDELHLLRDSLGAVDSHYESLLDHLEQEIASRKPKILASSATLTGYERQIELLYQRSGRVFPVPGPALDEGFWTADSDALARKYVAVAPRGVTLEYAVDRAITELQTVVRRLAADPHTVCLAAGVDPNYADMLVSLYGVDVVYGNTLRDIDAVERSFGTQLDVDGPLNLASLTGRTGFEDVRMTLDALDHPTPDFAERLHVITASSMMSHGVDIDRLNVMVMLGVPLTTAEFIQATARVGRKWPGLVYVMHKIGRERDASVFRNFEKYISHGDRFVEPIPITRRSRRVLEKTVAGMALARILAIHEVRAGEALTTVNKLRTYFQKNGITEESELASVVKLLAFNDPIDEALRSDLKKWYRRFFENLLDPAGTFTFPSDLSPTGKPMRSLRDVEEQAPVVGI